MTWHDGMFSGCLPRDDRLGAQFPVAEDKLKIIPRSDWQSIIADRAPMRPLIQKIKQQTYGSCASHSTTLSYETAFVQAFGTEDWIEFSPNSMYPHLSSRANSGSTIGGNMRQIMDVGVLPCPTDKAKQFLKDAGVPVNTREENDYYGAFPNGWKDTAKHFRAAEVFDIASWDGVISCLLIGMPVIVGRRGHAICYLDPVEDGETVVYANSWSPQWGDSGFGQDTESIAGSAIRSYGAFAIRSVWMNDKFIELMRE